ncbi:hypothetical protein PIB30_101782 [Stylosanthes scabra]|uniref:Uncharacterized protein n=1 Tax=Stylosanthes scabra TaxID=79078 RepID=A0ABU6TX23_9FABA|nr:hypothetical protein [Stylosanthes scabra]
MVENHQGDQGAMAAVAVRIPHELPSIYRWVSNNLLGAPSIFDQGYLDELKETGILFSGGDLERRYRVEAARRGERVCYLNLDHPTIPHWLWMNEVMFTDFGVRAPFTDFQQRLLNRASVAPSQLHPNAWSSNRCFELVGFDIAPVTYQGLNADQKDTTDILIFLFSKNNLSSKYLLGNLEETRKTIVEMAGNNVSLARLRNLLHSTPTRAVPTASGPSSVGRAVSPPIIPTTGTRVLPQGESSSEARRISEQLVDISSPIQEEEPLPAPTSPGKCAAKDILIVSKWSRLSKGVSREFSAMDRSFDASGFIGASLLGPRA